MALTDFPARDRGFATQGFCPAHGPHAQSRPTVLSSRIASSKWRADVARRLYGLCRQQSSSTFLAGSARQARWQSADRARTGWRINFFPSPAEAVAGVHRRHVPASAPEWCTPDLAQTFPTSPRAWLELLWLASIGSHPSVPTYAWWVPLRLMVVHSWPEADVVPKKAQASGALAAWGHIATSQ